MGTIAAAGLRPGQSGPRRSEDAGELRVMHQVGQVTFLQREEECTVRIGACPEGWLQSSSKSLREKMGSQDRKETPLSACRPLPGPRASISAKQLHPHPAHKAELPTPGAAPAFFWHPPSLPRRCLQSASYLRRLSPGHCRRALSLSPLPKWSSQTRESHQVERGGTMSHSLNSGDNGWGHLGE